MIFAAYVSADTDRRDQLEQPKTGAAYDGTPDFAFYVPDLVSLPSHLAAVDPSSVGRHALTVGSILLAWWLVSVAAGGELFAATHAFIASPVGMLLLLGWSIAFFYHLCNGIRHLAWDAGYGFEIRDAYRSGYAVLAATAVLTVLAWLYVLLA